jgi:hypothetical protein
MDAKDTQIGSDSREDLRFRQQSLARTGGIHHSSAKDDAGLSFPNPEKIYKESYSYEKAHQGTYVFPYRCNCGGG